MADPPSLKLRRDKSDFLKQGPNAAAFGILGLSAGTLISAIYLLILKLFRDKRDRWAELSAASQKITLDKEHGVGALIRLAIPITLSSTVLGVTKIADMALIMRRLQDIGVTSAASNRIYGAYTTLALPIFGLVPAFVPPITESLIPRLSAAVETNNKLEERYAVSGAARLTVFIAMPASMGLALYSRDIIALLFGREAEALEIASPLLSMLGASVLFSCLVTATNAMLQSYRRVVLPMISLGAGAVVKAVSAYFLIGNPEIGVMGAPISTLLCNVTVLSINLCFITSCVSGKTGILIQLPKPFFASVISMLASYAVYIPLKNTLAGSSVAFIGAFCIAILAYVVLCFWFRVINKNDISILKINKKES